MKEIKVIIAGPRGRMGHEAVLLMERTEHFNLVAAVDYKHGGEKISDLPGMPALDAPIYADLHTCLEEVGSRCVVRFNNARSWETTRYTSS